MARIAIIGDVHLGRSLEIGKPGIGGQYNSRVVDQIKLLDWCRHEALHNNVTDIVLTGDITEESKPDYYLIDEFFKWIGRCREDNLHLHIIMGNHDLKRFGANVQSPLDLLNSGEIEGVSLYRDPTTVQIGDLAITFLPFRDKRMHGTSNKDAVDELRVVLREQAAEIQPGSISILIGHLALEGCIPIGDEFDDSLNELMLPLDMFHQYQQVWMGHVHKYQILEANPLRAHVGSMDRSNFGEGDEKKFLVMIDKEGHRSIPLPLRPLVKVSVQVEGEDATEMVLKELDGISLKGAIVRVEARLIGGDTLGLDRQRIQQVLQKAGVHHIAGIVETRSMVVMAPDKISVSADLHPKDAVVIWAQQKEFEGEDRDLFLEFCNETIEEAND